MKEASIVIGMKVAPSQSIPEIRHGRPPATTEAPISEEQMGYEHGGRPITATGADVIARRRPAMNDAMGAGMLRGWVMLWNIELAALLAAIVLVLGAIALVEVVTSICKDGR